MARFLNDGSLHFGGLFGSQVMLAGGAKLTSLTGFVNNAKTVADGPFTAAMLGGGFDNNGTLIVHGDLSITNAENVWLDGAGVAVLDDDEGTGNLKVIMHPLDVNSVFVGNMLAVGGTTTIDMNAGNDVVVLNTVGLRGKTMISLGAGNDSLTARGLLVQHDLTVNGGLGNDTVDMDDVFIWALSTVNLGDGDDVFNLETVDDDKGSTMVGDAQASTNAGRHNVRRISLIADLGRGNDAVTIGRPGDAGDSVQFGMHAVIKGGDGTDVLHRLTAPNTFLSGGFVEDSVFVD